MKNVTEMKKETEIMNNDYHRVEGLMLKRDPWKEVEGEVSVYSVKYKTCTEIHFPELMLLVLMILETHRHKQS